MENNEQEAKQGVELRLTSQFLNAMLGVIALILWIITRVCVSFGVAPGVFTGIMSLLIFSLTFCGTVWAYVRNKKPTLELVLNAGILLLALCFMPW